MISTKIVTMAMGLVAITTIPDVVSFTDSSAGWGWEGEGGAAGHPPDPGSAAREGAAPEEGAAGADKLVVWVHAALALGVLAVGMLLHMHVRPYAFQFQNYLETFLFICSGVVIMLATVYTFMPSKHVLIEVSLIT